MRTLPRSVTKLLVAVLAVACVAAASATASPLNTQHQASGSVLTWQNGHYLINGKPFFPVTQVVTRCPDQDDIDRMIAVGINVIQGYSTTCTGNLHEMLRGRAWWVELASGNDPSTSGDLPELLTVGGGLRTGVSHGPLNTNLGDTLAFARCTQVTTTSMYNQARSHEGPRLYGMIMMKKIKPSWTNCVGPKSFESDFWTAIAARVDGLNFLLQSSDGTASPPLFDPAPGLEAKANQLKRQFGAIKQFVVNGTEIKVSTTNRSVGVAAWKYKGKTVIVAVNTSNKPVTARLSLPKAASPRAAQALWERRSVKLINGSFAQRFDGLEAHIYRGR